MTKERIAKLKQMSEENPPAHRKNSDCYLAYINGRVDQAKDDIEIIEDLQKEIADLKHCKELYREQWASFEEEYIKAAKENKQLKEKIKIAIKAFDKISDFSNQDLIINMAFTAQDQLNN